MHDRHTYKENTANNDKMKKVNDDRGIYTETKVTKKN